MMSKKICRIRQNNVDSIKFDKKALALLKEDLPLKLGKDYKSIPKLRVQKYKNK